MRGLATCGLGADSPRQVLYLTHHSPWPAHSGGTVREAQLLTALSAEFRIDVVGVCRSMAADPGEVAERLGVRSVDFFGDEARRTLRRQRYSAKLEQLLTCQLSPLERVDLVHVEGGYLFHLLPATRHDRTCLVEHNIESDILGQIARIRGSAALDAGVVSGGAAGGTCLAGGSRRRGGHRRGPGRDHAPNRADRCAGRTERGRPHLHRRAGHYR